MPTQGEHIVSSSKLLTSTMKALAERPRVLTYEVIAEECGVSARWLQQLVAGKIEDPGVCKVEAVYVFVTGKPLNV